MAKKWTKKERREHLKEKYFEAREKTWVGIAFSIVFIVLLYTLHYAFATGADWVLKGLLVVIILILIPIAAFAISMVFHEGE